MKTIILLIFIITITLFKLYLVFNMNKNKMFEKYEIDIDEDKQQDQKDINIEIIKAEDKIYLDKILEKYYKTNIKECTIKKFEGDCDHYCNTIKAYENLNYIKNTHINSYMFDPYIMGLGEYHTILYIYIYICKECKTVYYSLEMKRGNFRY